MASFFENLLPGAVGAYGLYDQYDSLNKTKQEARDTLDSIQTSVESGTTFQPYGVTSNLGSASSGVQSNGEYGTSYTLSPEAKAIQDEMFKGGRGLLQGTLDGSASRQDDVYNRMQQSMAPEQQRQRAMMEQRLRQQGRGGMTSQMYGGTPEQLAYEKALQEQASSNWLGAGEFANQELNSEFERGLGMMQQGYIPQDYLYNLGQQNIQMNQLNDARNAQRQGMLAEMGLGGLTIQNNIENLKGKALADFAQSQSANLGALGNFADSSLTTAWNTLFGNNNT